MTTMTRIVSMVAAAALGLSLVALCPQSEVRAAQALMLEEATGETFEALGEPLDIFLADASAILLGPGAAVRIDQFHFDPATGAGVLRLTILRGAVRISGGLLNDAAAIEIATPHAALSLEGGAALVIVDERRTRAHLLNGQRLTVRASGVTRELTRSEFAVSAFGGVPSAPTRMSSEQLASDFGALAAGLAGVETEEDYDLLLAAVDTDELTSPTSLDRPPAFEPSFALGGTLSGAGTFQLEPGDSTTAVAGGASTVSSFFATGPGIDGDFSETSGRQDLSLERSQIPSSQSENTTFIETDRALLVSDREIYEPRKSGPTTNKIFLNSDFSQTSDAPASLSSFNEEGGGLVYVHGNGGIIFAPFEEAFLPAEHNEDRAGKVFGLDGPGGFETGDSPSSDPAGYDRGISAEMMFVPCCSENLPSNANVAGARFSPPHDPDDFLPVGAVPPAGFPQDTIFNAASFEAFGADVIGLAAGMGDIFAKEQVPDQLREPSNFVYLEVTPEVGDGRLVFSAGDLDGVLEGSAQDLTVDAFSAAAGIASNSRSFVRSNTWTDLHPALPNEPGADAAPTDSGLFVVNPKVENGTSSTILFESAALHADFGLASFGADANGAAPADQQVSRITATIGKVEYRQSSEIILASVLVDLDEDGRIGELEFDDVDYDDDGVFGEYEVDFESTEISAVDAITTGRTIGSSNDGRGGSVSLQGAVMSTAAGGGNPEIPGRMGYFVLENAGAVWDDVRFPENNGSFTLPGGTERPVGTAEGTRFAIARLGIGTASDTLSHEGRGSARAVGFATGLVEVPGSGGIGVAPFATFSPDHNVAIDAIMGDATTLTVRMTGTDGRAPRTFALGGAGASAYVDRDRYGARSPDGADAAVAAISGNLVAAELADGGFRTSGGVPITGDDLDYEHLKWGFFFGDLVAEGPPGSRSHVHLGSFAAGPPIDHVNLPREGVATYAGHALGEVVDRGQRRLSLGKFEETFNFKNRTGQTMLDFDGRVYKGGGDHPGGSTLQVGDYASKVAAPEGFAGELAGRFTGPMMSGSQPASLVGQFRLTNGVDDPAASYRAVGTFAGEKQ